MVYTGMGEDRNRGIEGQNRPFYPCLPVRLNYYPSILPEEEELPVMSEELKPIRTVGKRGKDKQPRKQRTDINPNTALQPEERMNILKHNLQLYQLTKVDPNNPTELHTRVCDYFAICTTNQIMPSVAGFALALGIDRRTLWTWLTGERATVKNPECVDIIKNTYNLLNAQYEDLMNTGKINPVAGIFLMKNNMGYKDQTDHIITARQEQVETEETILDRANLLTDGNDSDYS